MISRSCEIETSGNDRALEGETNGDGGSGVTPDFSPTRPILRSTLRL